DPKRLRDSAEMPALLHDALRGLESQQPSAAVVTRVQKALSGLPTSSGGPGPTGIFAIAAAVGVLVLTAWMRVPHEVGQQAAKPNIPLAAPEAPQLPAAGDDAQPAQTVAAAPPDQRPSPKTPTPPTRAATRPVLRSHPRSLDQRVQHVLSTPSP